MITAWFRFFWLNFNTLTRRLALAVNITTCEIQQRNGTISDRIKTFEKN